MAEPSPNLADLERVIEIAIALADELSEHIIGAHLAISLQLIEERQTSERRQG